MKHLKLSLLFLSISLLTVGATAEEPKKKRFGQPGQAEQGKQAKQRRNRPNRDPAKMAARMMRQFDQDGDQKLDSTELAKMLTAMQRGRGMMRGRPGRPGEGKQRRRRGGDAKPPTPGGDRPRRPPAEEQDLISL